jgi:hypothetical protein
LLQNKRSREVREERRIKRERIEEKVGARDHCGRRIRAEKPTGPADLRRENLLSPAALRKNWKRGKGEGVKGFIGGQNLEEGVGYRQEEEIGRCGRFPCFPRSLAGAR